MLIDAEWVAVLSPIFIISLLMFVSGVPLVEARCDDSYLFFLHRRGRTSPRSFSLGSLFCGLLVDTNRVSSNDRYNAKFSNNASYQRYKNGTSLIIPWFPAPPASTDAAIERHNDIVSTTPYAPRSIFCAALLVYASDVAASNPIFFCVSFVAACM
jgi:hypothetical protein